MGETDLFYDSEYVEAIYRIKSFDFYQPLTKETYVYFIYDTEFVKIGIADEIASRISSLQTGNARKLELLAYMVFKGRGSAVKAESELHKLFDAKRLEGEWFDIMGEDRLWDLLKHEARRDYYQSPSKKWQIICTANQRMEGLNTWSCSKYTSADDYANYLKNSGQLVGLHGRPTADVFKEYEQYCSSHGKVCTGSQRELTRSIRAASSFWITTKTRKINKRCLQCFNTEAFMKKVGDSCA